jgi:hypothetical protein
MTRIRKLATSICLLLSVIMCAHLNSPPAYAAPSEAAGCTVVREALDAAAKLQVGMLRADIERAFELDGGLSVQDRGIYTYVIT